jgi:SPX domain protein involved in polyphosphate accumulation
MPLTKCIRIRHYHFQPGIYFEVKYNGGTKIRALIDKNYNLLEKDKLEEDYKDVIVSLLNKIKEKKVNPIFSNTYKRLSFVYKNDPSMRITIDSNIEFFHNNIYKRMDKDILEFKIPYNVSLDLANEYLKEINQLAGTNLVYAPFSKFEYYYYKVILGKN